MLISYMGCPGGGGGGGGKLILLSILERFSNLILSLDSIS